MARKVLRVSSGKSAFNLYLQVYSAANTRLLLIVWGFVVVVSVVTCCHSLITLCTLLYSLNVVKPSCAKRHDYLIWFCVKWMAHCVSALKVCGDSPNLVIIITCDL